MGEVGKIIRRNSKMIGNILNIVVCAFLVLAIMTPTKNYFTVMVGLFVLYVILDFGIMKRKKKKMSFSLEINRNLWYGIGTFFTCLFISAFIAGDIDDIKLTFSFFKSAIALVMIAYMIAKNPVTLGSTLAFAGSTVGILAYSTWQILQNPTMRIDCFYGHPNDFAKMIISLLPCLIFLAWNAGKKLKIVFLVECILLYVCLFYTSSRGVIVGEIIGGVVACVGLIALLRGQTNQKYWTKCVVLIGSLALCAGVVFLYNIQSQRTGPGFLSSGERIEMWESSIDMWKDHPLAGVGAAKWNVAYAATYHKPGIKEMNLGFPHNMFMYFLACFGSIGVAGYIGYLFFTIKGLWESAVRYRNSSTTFSLIMLFTAFFIEGCVDNTLNYKLPATLYFISFGYLLMQYRISKGREKEVMHYDSSK